MGDRTNKFKYLEVSHDVESIVQQIEETPPLEGIVVFIDIVGSTVLKDQNLPEWVVKIYHTFRNIKMNHPNLQHPLKGIGDELMFYIPDDQLDRNDTETPYLDLFSALVTILTDKSSMPYGDQLMDVKIHAGYCRNVFPLSFIKDQMDVYGRDIDTVAHMGKRVSRKQLIINQEFHELLVLESENIPDPQQKFPALGELEGPHKFKAKGSHRYVTYHKWTAARSE